MLWYREAIGWIRLIRGLAMHEEADKTAAGDGDLRVVSLETISKLVDAHRSTIRRWLSEAGIRPIAMGRGRRGAIRYRWRDIERWLTLREEVD